MTNRLPHATVDAADRTRVHDGRTHRLRSPRRTTFVRRSEITQSSQRREIGQHAGARLPKIYYVNWFRKSTGGDFLWPGFGENGRVLKWVFERCTGKVEGKETPIGTIPAPGELDLQGLAIDEEDIRELLEVNVDGWLAEIPLIREYYHQFGTRMPAELERELDQLEARLRAAKS